MQKYHQYHLQVDVGGDVKCCVCRLQIEELFFKVIENI